MVSTSLVKRGRGRPKGAKNRATLEKAAVMEEFNQRVMNAADTLFNAQLKLATGSQIVFRVDPVLNDKGKVVKEEHVHVTDPYEIKALLDEYEGSNGTVDGHYYYFQAVMPNNQAIDSLLNRTFGKAKETHEVDARLLIDATDPNSPEFKCRRFIDTALDCEINGKKPTLDDAYELLLNSNMGVENEIKVGFVGRMRRKEITG
jgi:hypothetical protein